MIDDCVPAHRDQGSGVSFLFYPDPQHLTPGICQLKILMVKFF